MSSSKEWNILFEWCVPHQHWLTQRGTLFLSVNQHGLRVLWLRTRENHWQVPSFRFSFVLCIEDCFQWLPGESQTCKVLQQRPSYCPWKPPCAIATFWISNVIADLICPQLPIKRIKNSKLSISRRCRIKTLPPLGQMVHVTIVYFVKQVPINGLFCNSGKDFFIHHFPLICFFFRIAIKLHLFFHFQSSSYSTTKKKLEPSFNDRAEKDLEEI